MRKIRESIDYESRVEQAIVERSCLLDDCIRIVRKGELERALGVE
jgi:hypothetical protein